MTPTRTTSPTEPSFYANHTDGNLENIIARYTDQSMNMGGALGREAMSIANAAWAARTIRSLSLS
jgi:hypothetical protein